MDDVEVKNPTIYIDAASKLSSQGVTSQVGYNGCFCISRSCCLAGMGYHNDQVGESTAFREAGHA